MNKETAVKIKRMFEFLDEIDDKKLKQEQTAGIMAFIEGYVYAILED